MAYVNVASWTNEQVSEWIKGLSDKEVMTSYAGFLQTAGVTGARLLQLRASDLHRLGVVRLGHQEIIMAAVARLQKLHFMLNSENLQQLAMRLLCKSRSLYQQLGGGEAVDVPAAAARERDGGPKQRVSVSILEAVTDLLTSVKDITSWLNTAPFDGQDAFNEMRSRILEPSIQLVVNAQRDSFAIRPVDGIRVASKQLADVCQSIIQNSTDSLTLLPAPLLIMTIKRKADEPLGMHIVPDISGVPIITGVKFQSPAHICGKLEAGDEIVQVNYQTVVGWQLDKVIDLLQDKEFGIEVYLTVKKRPRHSNLLDQVYFRPFRLPNKKRTAYRWSPSPRPALLLTSLPKIKLPPKMRSPEVRVISSLSSAELSVDGDESGVDEDGSDVDAAAFLTSSGTAVGRSASVAAAAGGDGGRTLVGSPTGSVRQYLPKPTRVTLQRRATVTGASPTGRRSAGSSSLDRLVCAARRRLDSSDSSSGHVVSAAAAVGDSLSPPSPPPRSRRHLLDRSPSPQSDSGDDAGAAYTTLTACSSVSPLDDRATVAPCSASGEKPRLEKCQSAPAYDAVPRDETFERLLSGATFPNGPSIPETPESESSGPEEDWRSSSPSVIEQHRHRHGVASLASPATRPPSPVFITNSSIFPADPLSSVECSDSATEAILSPSEEVFSQSDIVSSSKVALSPSDAVPSLSEVSLSSPAPIISSSEGVISSSEGILSPSEVIISSSSDPPSLSSVLSSISSTKLQPTEFSESDIQVVHNVSASTGATDPSDCISCGVEAPEERSTISVSGVTEDESHDCDMPSASRGDPPVAPSPLREIIDAMDVAFRGLKTSLGDLSRPEDASPPPSHTPATGRGGTLIRQRTLLFLQGRRVSCRDLGQGDCQGWLYVKKERRGLLNQDKWVKRWFVLTQHTLYGYKNKESDRAEFLVSMPGFKVSPAKEVRSKRHAFRVLNNDRSVVFAADSQLDMTKWMNKMGLSAIAYNSGHNYTTGGFLRPEPEGGNSDNMYYSETDEDDDKISFKRPIISSTSTGDCSLPPDRPPCANSSLDRARRKLRSWRTGSPAARSSGSSGGSAVNSCSSTDTSGSSCGGTMGRQRHGFLNTPRPQRADVTAVLARSADGKEMAGVNGSVNGHGRPPKPPPQQLPAPPPPAMVKRALTDIGMVARNQQVNLKSSLISSTTAGDAGSMRMLTNESKRPSPRVQNGHDSTDSLGPRPGIPDGSSAPRPVPTPRRMRAPPPRAELAPEYVNWYGPPPSDSAPPPPRAVADTETVIRIGLDGSESIRQRSRRPMSVVNPSSVAAPTARRPATREGQIVASILSGSQTVPRSGSSAAAEDLPGYMRPTLVSSQRRQQQPPPLSVSTPRLPPVGQEQSQRANGQQQQRRAQPASSQRRGSTTEPATDARPPLKKTSQYECPSRRYSEDRRRMQPAFEMSLGRGQGVIAAAAGCPAPAPRLSRTQSSVQAFSHQMSPSTGDLLNVSPADSRGRPPSLNLRQGDALNDTEPRTPLKPAMGVSMIGKQRRTPTSTSPSPHFVFPPTSPPPTTPGSAARPAQQRVLPTYDLQYPPVFTPCSYSLEQLSRDQMQPSPAAAGEEDRSSSAARRRLMDSSTQTELAEAVADVTSAETPDHELQQGFESR